MGLGCNGWAASMCGRGAKAEWPVLWLESVFKHPMYEVHIPLTGYEHAQFDFCILFKIVGKLAYLNKEKIIIKKIDSHILKNACDTTERLNQFHKGRFPNCYSLIRFTQSIGTP